MEARLTRGNNLAPLPRGRKITFGGGNAASVSPQIGVAVSPTPIPDDRAEVRLNRAVEAYHEALDALEEALRAHQQAEHAYRQAVAARRKAGEAFAQKDRALDRIFEQMEDDHE